MKLVKNEKGQEIIMINDVGILLEKQIKCPVFIDPEIEEEYEEHEFLFLEQKDRILEDVKNAFDQCNQCEFKDYSNCTKARNIFKEFLQKYKSDI